MASTEQPEEVPGVNVTDSQAVQVGSGNTMYANWAPKPPLDPAVLRGRSPHKAVTLLQQLSHDDLVDFFIRASPEDVSEILEVFSEVDLSKVVATFGDLSRRKATELIESVHEPSTVKTISGQLLTHLLNELPEAAEAIARKAARLGWANAEPLEAFREGYTRKYDNGHVFWTPSSGVVRTTGAIDDYWAESGPDWGFPVKDQKHAPTSPYGSTGFWQEFQHGAVYSSNHGVFLLTDAMCYQDEGSSGGWLGFPVSERQRNGRLGDRQMFEGGTIYSYVVEGPERLESFAVRQEVTSNLTEQWRWRPVSKEVATGSPYGTQGTVQHFEIEVVGMEDITGKEVYLSYETAVFSSKVGGVVVIPAEVWDYYCRDLGAEESWLGFPVEQVEGVLSSGETQIFEGGTIYWQYGIAPIAVRAAVVKLAEAYGSLGFPVSEEQPVGTGASESIQFFQGGVVTLRDSKYEVWVRPDSEFESPKPRKWS